ncbi:MAG: protein phosphatase 2C domain-containing protein [Cohnella sp.]|nr:protein phosphatase 2C domain-containing protein [Cohnella sp.]
MRFGPMCIGKYGGNIRAGAHKNEDGLLVAHSPDGNWEFAVIADAHASSESEEFVLGSLVDRLPDIETVLNGNPAEAFDRLRIMLDERFRDPAFLERSKQIRGECSCLIVARKGRYVWWHSIGDCMLYLLHPDLMAFDQTMLNQRNFYEWIGRDNTYDDEVACYSTGTRRLRSGTSLIVMATDGFVAPGIGYERTFSEWMKESTSEFSLERLTSEFLQRLHERETVDSTTLIAWAATIE